MQDVVLDACCLINLYAAGKILVGEELLDRIRELEEQNSALQDKLDAIYSILAPDYEALDDDLIGIENSEP